MAIFKGCYQKTAESSVDVMAVFKGCHQRLPKVLLKWWLSLKAVNKDCPKFWLSLKIKVLLNRMAVFQGWRKDCKSSTREKDYTKNCSERLLIKILWKSRMFFFCLGAGIAPHFACRVVKIVVKCEFCMSPILLPHLVRVGRSKLCRALETVVKCKMFELPEQPVITSCLSDTQNCCQVWLGSAAKHPFRHVERVAHWKLLSSANWSRRQASFRHVAPVGRSALW